MDLAVVQEKMESVFRDVMDDDSIVLKDSLTAENIEDWDSLNHVLLMVTLEQTFSIKFDSSKIPDLKNVGDIKQLILQSLDK